MKKHLTGIGVIAALALLAGCLLNLPPVSLPQARAAWTPVRTVSEITFALPSFVCTVDNGSTADMTRLRNSGGTLLYEAPKNTSTYPWAATVTFQSYPDSGTGYTISGTVTRTSTSPSAGTRGYGLSLTNADPATYPVALIRGSLSYTSGGETGTISFNANAYLISDL